MLRSLCWKDPFDSLGGRNLRAETRGRRESEASVRERQWGWGVEEANVGSTWGLPYLLGS